LYFYYQSVNFTICPPFNLFYISDDKVNNRSLSLKCMGKTVKIKIKKMKHDLIVYVSHTIFVEFIYLFLKYEWPNGQGL
jgi:hypothetical protein